MNSSIKEPQKATLVVWKVLLIFPAIMVNQVALSIARNWFTQGDASTTKWLAISGVFFGSIFFVYRVVQAQRGRSLLVLAGVGVATLLFIALALCIFAFASMGPLR